jgi:hypothetical protein
MRFVWVVCFGLAAVSCGDDGGDVVRCEGAGDCEGRACVAALDVEGEDLAPLELVCSSERQGRGPGVACERGEECAAGVCLLAGACAVPCAGQADCSARERCQAVYARGEAGRFHPLAACVAMADLPFEVETRAAAFSGGIDALQLPATQVPTLFVIEHLDDHDWPVPPSDTTCRPPLCAVSLSPRDGDVWFDREQLTDPDGPINPLAVGDHVHPLSVLVPNGPRARPSATGYTLQLESKLAGRARVTRVAREPAGGRLDLNVFYVGTSVTSELLREALAEVDRIFEPAEVFVGELREIHVTGELLERGSELPDAEASRGFAELELQYGVYPQLPELFKLSAGAGNIALDVFLVADIESASDADLGGLSGGTPVPFGMHGTGASGIAIAADMLSDQPVQLGRTLAHELGHALGLFHTTERNGEVFDAFSDTPSCSPERDGDANGLDASECQEAGADNLMFPSTDAAAAHLSEQQSTQLRAAMVLQ